MVEGHVILQMRRLSVESARLGLAARREVAFLVTLISYFVQNNNARIVRMYDFRAHPAHEILLNL